MVTIATPFTFFSMCFLARKVVCEETFEPYPTILNAYDIAYERNINQRNAYLSWVCLLMYSMCLVCMLHLFCGGSGFTQRRQCSQATSHRDHKTPGSHCAWSSIVTSSHTATCHIAPCLLYGLTKPDFKIQYNTISCLT